MKRKYIWVLSLVVILCLAVGMVVLAQTSASYDLSWHVVGGGGGVSSSSHYAIRGTGGQSAASPPIARGADYTVSSGYWFAGTTVYLPLIIGE